MSIIKDRMKGFTMVEMAVVLAISGLLAAGSFQLLSSSNDTAKYKETQNQMSEIKEALITDYLKMGRLPCPDTDGDGIENPPNPAVDGTCTSYRGFLPHITLNIANSSADAWGERFRYIVSADNNNFFTKVATSCNYTRPTTTPISTDTTIAIKDLNTAADSYLAQYSAFALLSTGKNGRQTNSGMTGAFTNDGGCSSLSALEQENCNNDSVLRFGAYRGDANSIVFDDQITWMGDIELLGHFMQVGCNGSVSVNVGSGTGTDTETSDPAPQQESNQCQGFFGMLMCILAGIIKAIIGLFT